MKSCEVGKNRLPGYGSARNEPHVGIDSARKILLAISPFGKGNSFRLL